MDVASAELVLYTVEAGVATLTLNRPERSNGWTGELTRAYFGRLEQAARDPLVRSIVVTGAGRAFSVGGDGAKLSGAAAERDTAPIAAVQPYWFPLRIGKPVIAAINGPCFGIGLQQVLCCDIRMAADDAKFSTAYARRGLVAEYGMSWLLPRLVGTGHAMDMLLSARLVRAPEAERIGLVNRVVPARDLLDEAQGYARELAVHCAPSSLAAIKRQMLRDLVDTLPAACDRASAMLDDAMRSDDFREGVRSWQEQRAPNFPPLAPEQAIFDLN